MCPSAPPFTPALELLFPQCLDTRVAATSTALVWLGRRGWIVIIARGSLDELLFANVGDPSLRQNLGQALDICKDWLGGRVHFPKHPGFMVCKELYDEKEASVEV